MSSTSSERSLQSLWKIITGHSSITNHDLIIEELSLLKDVLMSGLSYYKPRSPKSQSTLKSSKTVKGRKLEFIILISEHLGLDELLSRSLFQNFLVEGYRGSYSEVNQKLSNEAERQSLLTQIEDYYYKERLHLLRCLKQFFGYWQDGNHPYREVYERALVEIQFDGSKFIPGVWEQFEEISLSDVPANIQSAERELKWLKQSTLEQIELMEILLLFYKDYEMSAELMAEKFTLFQRIGYGLVSRARYSPGIHGDPLSHHLSSLSVLVLLEGLDLEYLLQKQENNDKPEDHHLSKNTKLELIEAVLKDASHFPCQTPLFLCWFILRYTLAEADGDMGCGRLLGNMALRNGVFEVILNTLSSPYFTGERPVSGVCQSMYYTVLSLAVTFFNEESLQTDSKILYEIASLVLCHPRLRLTFWEKGLNKELGLLLGGVLTRFPHSSVVDLLLPLSRDEYSANRVFNLLDNLENYSEELVPHSLARFIEIGSEEGTWVLLVPRPILEAEYHTLGLAPLVLGRGTVGVVLEERKRANGRGDVQLVSWAVGYSGWDLLASMVQSLLSTPGVGVDPEPHPHIEFLTKMYKLVTEVIRFDYSISKKLKPVISLIYSILHKFALLPHPPVSLISCCIDCLSVLAEGESPELWTQLSKTKFPPEFLSPFDRKNSFQTSPGSYGLLLNNWERARGVYPVTMAMLRLLLNTLKSCDGVYHQCMVASAVYIMQTVFASSHNWRYHNQLQRDKFCNQLLSLCCAILEDERAEQAKDSSTNVLFNFVVNLLLNSTGHLLLVNTMGTGVDSIDRLTASAASSSQPSIVVESLKLCFTITDLLLKGKTDTSISTLEDALATRTIHHPSLSFSSTEHLITELFKYIHHSDDPSVPVGAVKLLGRLATVAPMSMFSCIGDEAKALKDRFISRLSAISENTDLRRAILQFISCCISTQPGLLELFIALKPKPDKPASTTAAAGHVTSSHVIDEDSCLWPVLDMIDKPDKQVLCVPPRLLTTGVSLLQHLWQARHTRALEALPASKESFWKNITGILTEKVDTKGITNEEVLIQKLLTASYVISLVAMELYYVMDNQLDKSLKLGLQNFVKKDGYSSRSQCLQDIGGDDNLGVVSMKLLKVQEQLAESWNAFIIVAANHHESLFDLHTKSKRSTVLNELMAILQSQADRLPHSEGVMRNVLNLYLSLIKKWESVDCRVLDQLSNVLDKMIKCEASPQVWALYALVYSIIVVAMTTIKKNEEDVEPRYVCGLVPSIENTLQNHTHYSKLPIKHCPEVYCIIVLSEVTLTLPHDHPAWLTTLRHHSIVMILARIACGYLDALIRPDLVETIFVFFLNLANSTKGAELLQVNNISHLLCISLENIVSKLESMGTSVGNSLSKVSVPPPEWMRVWFVAVKLTTRLLNVLSHRFINNVMDFIGVHHERIQHCLDVYVATRHLQATEETKIICQFLHQLVHYREQWQFHLLQQHNLTINKLVQLLSGSIALLSRGRLKDIIKSMDSQGLLKPEEGSASVKLQDRRRRTSGGQVVISQDDDSWVRASTAYYHLHESLLAIVTSCVSVLCYYSPPISGLFMCTFTQPVDLSQYPYLFVINSMLPVHDPSSPPSINALTSVLTIGCDVLRKLDPQGGTHRGVTLSPSKTSPLRSPVTPFIPRLSSEITLKKRNEILYMLERTICLLISQSLRYLLDEGIHPFEKQTLKKHLVSELTNFCQTLLINFSRKGAPSPHTPTSTLKIATPLSSSSTTFHDSVSGRTSSSHSFNDTLEQGMFKLADMFARNLTRM